VAHRDGDVGDHVLVEASGLGRAERGVLHDEDLLESHVLHDSLVDFYWFCALRIHNLGLKLLKHLLSEQVIVEVVLLVVEGQGLLLAVRVVLLPTILVHPLSFLSSLHAAESGGVLWRIHAQALDGALVGDVSRGHEFHERQGVEPDQIPDEGLPASSAEVSSGVDQGVTCHAPVADNLEALLVCEWLGATLEVREVDLFLPLRRNLQVL